MKVAVFSESSADEASVRILVGGILGGRVEPVDGPTLRMRGWPSVLQMLPAVLKHLHYRTDAEALALVVDSNHSAVHTMVHDEAGKQNPDCRTCCLRTIVRNIQGQLSPVVNRPPIKVAMGVAVPAVEAWLQFGVNAQVSEAAWLLGLQSGNYPYTKKSLKEAVYGTSAPGIALETSRMIEESQRIVRNLAGLETAFPGGFGALAQQVRSWRSF
jgi:hypothetical protein